MFQEKCLNNMDGRRNLTNKDLDQIDKLKEQVVTKKSFEYGSWHGAMLCDMKGNVISIGINSSSCIKSYHAEFSCFHSLSQNIRIKNSILYIIRVSGNNYKNSAPCHKCFKLIKKFMKKKILYKVVFTLDENDKIFTFTKNDLLYES